MNHICDIGNIALILLLFVSLVSIMMGSMIQYRGVLLDSYLDILFKRLSLSCFILVYFIFLLVLYGFIASDFSISLVANYSSNILPLKYKIGAIWSSQEGSIILWMLIVSIVFQGLFLYRYLSQFYVDIILIYLFQIILVVLLILCKYNPFIYNLGGVGIGLNPVLQDIALMIHPPILYCGYALSYGIFTITIISILYKDHVAELYKILYSLAKLCLFFISLGVFLGAWWAYRELGWGGYWFFDPVENISLMPLFFSVAYYHSIMVSRKDSSFVNITHFLGLSIFTVILIGTCFTRSGLLISVHSFVNESISGYYSVALSIILMLLVYLFFYIYSYKSNSNFSLRYLEFNKRSSIRIANYFWIVLVLLILITLCAPILVKILYDQDLTIEPNFFISSLIPIIIILISIMGAFSYILKPKTIIAILQILLSFIGGLSVQLYYGLNFVSLFGFIAGFYIIIVSLFSLFYCLQNSILQRKFSMIISHFGVGLLCLSITANKSFEKEFDVIGSPHDHIINHNFEFSIKDLRYSKGKNYVRQIVDLEIIDSNKNTIILSPERRLYIIEQSITSESNIMSFLLYDLYAVINNIHEETIHLKIYYKPFISLIWISSFLISFGVLASFFIKKNK